MEDDEPIDDLVERGNSLAECGDHVGAIEIFREVVARGDAYYFLNLGSSLNAIGLTAEAENSFRQGLESGDLDAGYELALLLDELGREDEAIKMHRSLSERGYARSDLSLAWFMHRDGAKAEAAEILESLVSRTDIIGIVAAGMLGFWQWEDGTTDTTEALLRRGLPEYPSAWEALGYLLRESGRPDEAIRLLLDGSAGGVEGTDLALGNVLSDLGRVDEATRAYLRADRREDSRAAYNLALLRREQGDEREYMLWLRRAVSRGDSKALHDLEEGGAEDGGDA